MSLQPWPGRVFPYVVGESDRMRAAYAVLTSVAQSDVNVCLQGEPGTGKALIAETLHAVGPRRHRPYIVLACAAGAPGLTAGRPVARVAAELGLSRDTVRKWRSRFLAKRLAGLRDARVAAAAGAHAD